MKTAYGIFRTIAGKCELACGFMFRDEKEAKAYVERWKGDKELPLEVKKLSIMKEVRYYEEIFEGETEEEKRLRGSGM